MLYQFDGRQPQVGETTYVSELAHVIGDVIIGERCYIGHGAILRGDYGRIVIGDETAVEEGVIIHAPPDDIQTIGRRVTMGHGAILHARAIGDWVVIGMGAVASLYSEVGKGSIVAEGSVVKSNQIIPDNVVAAGNPARVVRPVNARDEAMWTYGKQLYVDLAAKYREVGMIPISRH
ncbi:Isoleucine patch superfamily enzyme, carbonic anhydrase/acetyltransferase [Desulfosarcina cetonica]|uniref:gamma carbonic anhydrase family protein n=1 Tax=Desulfosarcina cetonica TaxID=90730 RepID=UPI0006D265C0|nr:gamma carbonic anhydrase family protein [Desulfosarcina cetonica]VTR70157.1 Isoleucine patch superfamily enzyme, carbonic anhydrase/acetyltransferase [Desulfosarcina cetonica]